MANETKNKLFGFFDYNRDNRPDAVEEDTTPTLKRYFKLLARRFWKLVTLNLMMLPLIIPALVCFYLYVSMRQTPVAGEVLFPQLLGANAVSATPTSTLLFDLFGAQQNIPVFTTWTYIGMGICIAFLVITFGWQNIGAAYIVRNMVRGEAVFVWSDYFYAIKRNLKQGFFLGLIDAVILFTLGFDISYFWGRGGTFTLDVGFYLTIALIVLYFLMRFYIYLLIVTFDLSIYKILKNALIFSLLGFKRNIMGVLGILLITALHVILLLLLISTPLSGLPIILPFLWYMAAVTFTSAYAAYPVIDRYMIAPYANQEDEEETEEESVAE
ncbi:MAG: DUF624 domain-containing protein [Clostridia bacterium]|nr:DUF624 domain-containing protein [Clostridia bacterium]